MRMLKVPRPPKNYQLALKELQIELDEETIYSTERTCTYCNNTIKNNERFFFVNFQACCEACCREEILNESIKYLKERIGSTEERNINETIELLATTEENINVQSEDIFTDWTSYEEETI